MLTKFAVRINSIFNALVSLKPEDFHSSDLLMGWKSQEQRKKSLTTNWGEILLVWIYFMPSFTNCLSIFTPHPSFSTSQLIIEIESEHFSMYAHLNTSVCWDENPVLKIDYYYLSKNNTEQSQNSLSSLTLKRKNWTKKN